MVADRLTSRVLDESDPRSFAARARARRWSEFLARFPDLGAMEVLDLGGVPSFWIDAPIAPAHVTTVNIVESSSDQPWLSSVTGDACSLATIGDRSFDLVVSNSTIEHLGGVARRVEFAEVVRRAADRWWIQTPYRYFPIEPHWLFPGFQFLPLRARIALTEAWPLGHRNVRSFAEAYELVQEVELVTITEMRCLFPEGEVWKERVWGLTKSIVAVRS